MRKSFDGLSALVLPRGLFDVELFRLFDGHRGREVLRAR
jgi:hypothetical protein